MASSEYCLIETEIGECALVWQGAAIIGASLPADNRTALLTRLNRNFPGATAHKTPSFLDETVANIQALMAGEQASFRADLCDRSAIEPFADQVYDITLSIPHGQTMTYGEVAVRLGGKHLSRAVGAALGANPIPIIIPCHRVIAKDGGLGGFSAPGGANAKMRLLQIEGAFRIEKLPLFQ